MAFDFGEGRIQWDNNFPRDRPQFIPIISPRPGSQTHCIITSDSWVGVYTHFIDQRTRPCTGSEIDCEGCFQKRGRRWKAYLCGIMVGTGRKCIIELTTNAMESCPGLIEAGPTLRGKRITLWRRNAAKNAPSHCRIDPPTVGQLIPPPVDLMTALCQVWGTVPEHNDDSGQSEGFQN